MKFQIHIKQVELLFCVVQSLHSSTANGKTKDSGPNGSSIFARNLLLTSSYMHAVFHFFHLTECLESQYLIDCCSFTLTSTCYEVLVNSTKTAMNCEVALSNSLKLSYQAPILKVPKMNTLRSHIEHSQAVWTVYWEGHYWLVLLQSVTISKQLNYHENYFLLLGPKYVLPQFLFWCMYHASCTIYYTDQQMLALVGQDNKMLEPV